ncbi:hypothetical protein [Viridibacillus arvi]|uniref:hypothetical protein n=1 Tax=Viridibacillus arvi TaxID=263475 RepID=UPI00187B2451|nr:hypothetical protein [Viridibacillus sp. JNUCC-6]QOV10475.1 hypothetical protein JNUCC6_18115 [Viridibacillus sp. JNUCC-6]
MVNNKLKLVKSATAFVIGAAVLTGSFAAAGSDTAFAKSSTSVKVSNGKLVYKSTGKVVKGYKTYNKALYKDGKKLTGLYKKTYYKAGKKATGTYKSVYYKAGKAFTGVTNKTYYKAGKKATGTYKNVYYKSGKAYTGVVNKTYYKAGKKATGLYKGVYYKTGKAATGIFEGQLYVSGNLSKGLTVYKDELYKDGSLNKGLVVFKDQLYKDAALNTGLALFQDQLYKDAVLNKGLVKFEDKFYFDAAIANGTYVDADNVERAIENGIEVGAKVKAIEAINATTLKVTFNKTVDKNTITPADFAIATLDATPVVAADLDGALSEDGKTYTLTIKDAATAKFDGRYDFTLKAGDIKTKANENVAAYTNTIKVSDTVAPTIAKVTTTPAAGNKVSVTVTFDEKLATLGTVSVDGVEATTSLNADNKSFTLSLDAGKTFKVDVVGAKDLVGNIAAPITTSVVTSEDTVAPTATLSTEGSTLKLKFSEEVQSGFAVKVNGGSALAAVQDSKDKTLYTVDASSALGTSSFLNNATVTVTGIKDLADNAGKDVSYTTNLTKDSTAPKFVSGAIKGNKLVLKFDEAIKSSTATALVAGDLAIKYVNSDGILVPLTATTDYTLAADAGYDINGNGLTDANTDEEKYVVITLTDANSTPKFTDASGNLLAGNFTFTLAKDKLTDAAGNTVAASTFTASPSSSDAAASVTYAAANGSANNQILVTYNEVMGAGALTAANYTLAGQSLPTGTTLTFINDKKNVLITLPAGSITTNGSRVLAVKDVTSSVGNTLDAKTQTVQSVNLKETVAPVAKSVTVNNDVKATVAFSEKLTSVTPSGLTVKVNGTTVTPSSLTINAEGQLEIAFASSTLKSTDKVSVEFASTNLADANGNTVADATFAN